MAWFKTCGLVAPNSNYWLTSDYRSFIGRYELVNGHPIHKGPMKVMGYFVLIRPYPDSIDTLIHDLHYPKHTKLLT